MRRSSARVAGGCAALLSRRAAFAQHAPDVAPNSQYRQFSKRAEPPIRPTPRRRHGRPGYSPQAVRMARRFPESLTLARPGSSMRFAHARLGSEYAVSRARLCSLRQARKLLNTALASDVSAGSALQLKEAYGWLIATHCMLDPPRLDEAKSRRCIRIPYRLLCCVPQARQLFDESVKRFADTDADAYNALLYAMVITRHTDEAFAHVSRMLAQGTPIGRLCDNVRSRS